MSFNEKLQTLRKENKLSQEQLADMLDVTRQSVSKWESGTTYPEMDKLITMCKIFKCSLDDLTNDEVSDINSFKKNNNLVNGIISNISELISETVEMIKSMTAGQVVGMLISLFILGMFLMFLRIPFTFIEEGFHAVVSNIPNKQVVGFTSGLFNLILDIIFFVLYILAFIYIYKVAYLDKYEKVEVELKGDNIKKAANKEKASDEVQKEVVKVNPPRTNKPYNEHSIFTFLGNMIMLFIRFLIGCFTIPFIFCLVMLFAALAIVFYLFTQKIFYIGAFISVVFAIVLNIWFLEACIVFVFNKKTSFKRLLWTFIIGLCGLGMGLGVFLFEIAEADYKDEVPAIFEKSEINKEIPMFPNLTLRDTQNYYYHINYVKDDALKDKVVFTASFYPDSRNIVISESGNYVDFHTYYLGDVVFNDKFRVLIKDSLRNKTFYNFDKLNFVEYTVRTSEENIKVIKDNTTKYLLQQEALSCRSYERTLSEYEDEIENYRDQIDVLNDKIDELEQYKQNVQEIIR